MNKCLRFFTQMRCTLDILRYCDFQHRCHIKWYCPPLSLATMSLCCCLLPVLFQNISERRGQSASNCTTCCSGRLKPIKNLIPLLPVGCPIFPLGHFYLIAEFFPDIFLKTSFVDFLSSLTEVCIWWRKMFLAVIAPSNQCQIW